MRDTESVITFQEAHVRPEDVKNIGGAQDVDDKIQTHLRHIEAAANIPGDDKISRLLWYGAVILSFTVGALFSGYDSSGDSGGIGNPLPVGYIDITPALDVMSSGVLG